MYNWYLQSLLQSFDNIVCQIRMWKEIYILHGYIGKMTEYFVGFLWRLSGKRGNKRKASLYDMLHLPYGPLLSWLHQHRQTNNTYKCEMCRFRNSIPVGVIVTSFKTELVRFGEETERGVAPVTAEGWMQWSDRPYISELQKPKTNNQLEKKEPSLRKNKSRTKVVTH